MSPLGWILIALRDTSSLQKDKVIVEMKNWKIGIISIAWIMHIMKKLCMDFKNSWGGLTRLYTTINWCTGCGCLTQRLNQRAKQPQLMFTSQQSNPSSRNSWKVQLQRYRNIYAKECSLRHCCWLPNIGNNRNSRAWGNGWVALGTSTRQSPMRLSTAQINQEKFCSPYKVHFWATLNGTSQTLENIYCMRLCG